MCLGRHRRLFDFLVVVAQTDIALPAVVALCLTEIPQQLPTATDIVRRGIFDHGVDSLAELFLPVFIHHRGNMDMLDVFTPLQIPHVGCLLLGDEVQDVFLAETL